MICIVLKQVLPAFLFFGLMTMSTGFTFAQQPAAPVTYSLQGFVEDAGTGEPILFANIFLEDNNIGTVSDSTGRFEFMNLQAGPEHLVISHVGCETRRFHLTIDSDTFFIIKLDHSHELLGDVVVQEDREPATTQSVSRIGSQQITENGQQNVSYLLEEIAGVSSLQTGSNIAKPVVHGLYGNRLMILNNGIAQAGQQWGNDHNPEIDPLAAGNIAVIKGVSALTYQGATLGSVVIIEPGSIEQEPHLNGRASYFFETNGRAHGLHTRLQQHTNKLAWRLTGTLKKSGDRHTPDYFLNNTGSQEANMSLQLQKTVGKRWNNKLYISSFNNKLGILRGSQAGNLSDLQQAIGRAVPFYTEEQFSYTIDAPRQEVHHHLMKASSAYILNESSEIKLTAAAQLNDRQEFDIRRGGRSNLPTLSLEQLTYFGEARYQKDFRNNINLKVGGQATYTNNTNQPETGILPLIPDYLSYKTGGFATVSKRYKKVFTEAGFRYDYTLQRVAAISQDLPRRIVRYENRFGNFGAGGGISYRYSDKLSLSANVGLARRNPAINELYSQGLHQGVSSIEEGNTNLQPETSFKTTFSVEKKLSKKLMIEGLFFHQLVRDYIYLQPQDEARLTIRGAFPVFVYTQTNARLMGADLRLRYHFTERLKATATYSYLHGQDLSHDLPLVFMPPNNLRAGIVYQIAKKYGLENIELTTSGLLMQQQSRLQDEQDFLAPPPSYFVTSFKVSAQKQLKKIRLTSFLRVDNLFDVAYRDYLDRQRYFADRPGRNIVTGISVVF